MLTAGREWMRAQLETKAPSKYRSMYRLLQLAGVPDIAIDKFTARPNTGVDVSALKARITGDLLSITLAVNAVSLALIE